MDWTCKQLSTLTGFGNNNFGGIDPKYRDAALREVRKTLKALEERCNLRNLRMFNYDLEELNRNLGDPTYP
jgi:hypothetical protein